MRQQNCNFLPPTFVTQDAGRQWRDRATANFDNRIIVKSVNNWRRFGRFYGPRCI